MKEFKLLDYPEESFYFSKPAENQNDFTYIFHPGSRSIFLNELNKQADIKKQAGYSKSKDCNFISVIIIEELGADAEFVGHHIKNSYVVKKNDKFELIDMNPNKYIEDENHSSFNATLYHSLPDGKVLEYSFRSSQFKNETEHYEYIYNNIMKFRLYYNLNDNLSKEDKSVKILKI